MLEEVTNDIGENLNVRFYEEAINLCKSKIDKFSFEVFTDDKWVSEQNILKSKSYTWP